MKTSKQRYMDEMRSNTAYPTYRGIVGIIAILGYMFAGLIVLLGVIVLVSPPNIMMWGPFGGGRVSYFVGALIVAVIIFVVVRFWKEASFILVDIADSITDSNAEFIWTLKKDE